MNHNDYYYFVLNKNSNPSYSFNGYTHKETGETWQIFTGMKDKKTGEDIPKRYKFDRAHRSIRVHKNEKSIKPMKRIRYEKDANGNERPVEYDYFLPVHEFIRNFPECKDSPNGEKNAKGEHLGWMFSEVKEKEDAETAIDAKKKKNEAVTKALNLSGRALKEMAVLYACFDPDETIQKHRVIDSAEADPQKFLDFYEAPERGAKALLKKAITLDVIKLKGTIHIFGNDSIGHNEEAAVATIMGDKELEDAIRANVKSMN